MACLCASRYWVLHAHDDEAVSFREFAAAQSGECDGEAGMVGQCVFRVELGDGGGDKVFCSLFAAGGICTTRSCPCFTPVRRLCKTR
jgi:hypothetical protein